MPTSLISRGALCAPGLLLLLLAGSAAAQTTRVRFEPEDPRWQLEHPASLSRCAGPCEMELAAGEHRFVLRHADGVQSTEHFLSERRTYVLSARRPGPTFSAHFPLAAAGLALGAGVGSGTFFVLGDGGAGGGLLALAIASAVALAIDIVDRVFPSSEVQLSLVRRAAR